MYIHTKNHIQHHTDRTEVRSFYCYEINYLSFTKQYEWFGLVSFMYNFIHMLIIWKKNKETLFYLSRFIFFMYILE